MSLSESEEIELLRLLEQERIDEARDNLEAYVRFIDVPGAPVRDDEDCEEFYPDTIEPAAHHILMLKVLERVEAGRMPRVMLFLPPGSAKSTYASVVFPPWFMGRQARRGVIAVSYNSDLAKKFGRKCRSIVRSPQHREAFGHSLTGDNAAVDDWSTENGSYYMASGILAGVTGNRAHGLLIDDPVKGREDADSQTIRDKTWEAYKSDLRTRLVPGGWIVIIQTRWHEDDLSGRILPENYAGESGWVAARDGEQWFVVNMPALCERDDDLLGRKPGEWLWPEWFIPAHWEQERRTQGARNWSALYQQRPAPEEGDFFRRDWFRYYDKAPPLDTLRIYGASDYAVTDDDGDWTVHGICGVDPRDNIYVLDWWRARTETDVWIERLLDYCEVWTPLEWAEEAGQINKSVGPFIKRRQHERKIWTYRRQYISAADKPTRAQSIRGRMAMGKVLFPANAPWREALETELLTFPSGRNDDQVDVMSLFGRMLDHMLTGADEKKDEPKMTDMNDVTLDLLWKDAQKRRNPGRV